MKGLVTKLAEIKDAALNGGFTSELRDQLFSLTVGYTTETTYLDFKMAFRGRPLDGELPNDLKELWHPLPSQVTKFGRANFPGEPVLYVANGELVVVSEVRGAVGSRIGILKLILTNPSQQPHVFSIGEIAHQHRTGRTLLGRAVDPAIKRAREAHPDFEKSLLLDDFFSDAFRYAGDKLYPLTAAISKFYLASDQIDGLVYPTVATDIGFNLALKPTAAKRFLTIDSAYVIRLEKKEGISFRARCIANSKVINSAGSIEWNTMTS